MKLKIGIAVLVAIAFAVDSVAVVIKASAGGNDLPYFEGFEGGTLPTGFVKTSETTSHDIDVVTTSPNGKGPYAGSYYLLADNAAGTTTRGFEFPIDLTGVTNAYMELYEADDGAYTGFPSGYVSLSDDGGSTWQTGLFINFHATADTTWALTQVDLDVLAGDAGLTLEDVDYIRIEGTNIGPGDEWYIDSITIDEGDVP